jgi:hypothetical protein
MPSFLSDLILLFVLRRVIGELWMARCELSWSLWISLKVCAYLQLLLINRLDILRRLELVKWFELLVQVYAHGRLVLDVEGWLLEGLQKGRLLNHGWRARDLLGHSCRLHEGLLVGNLRLLIYDLRLLIGDLRLLIGDLRLLIGDLRLLIGDLRLLIGNLRLVILMIYLLLLVLEFHNHLVLSLLDHPLDWHVLNLLLISLLGNVFYIVLNRSVVHELLLSRHLHVSLHLLVLRHHTIVGNVLDLRLALNQLTSLYFLTSISVYLNVGSRLI